MWAAMKHNELGSMCRLKWDMLRLRSPPKSHTRGFFLNSSGSVWQRKLYITCSAPRASLPRVLLYSLMRNREGHLSPIYGYRSTRCTVVLKSGLENRAQGFYSTLKCLKCLTLFPLARKKATLQEQPSNSSNIQKAQTHQQLANNFTVVFTFQSEIRDKAGSSAFTFYVCISNLSCYFLYLLLFSPVLFLSSKLLSS